MSDFQSSDTVQSQMIDDWPNQVSVFKKLASKFQVDSVNSRARSATRTCQHILEMLHMCHKLMKLTCADVDHQKRSIQTIFPRCQCFAIFSLPSLLRSTNRGALAKAAFGIPSIRATSDVKLWRLVTYSLK